MDKNDGSSSRLYCLPGRNGFHYNLRINCYGSDEGLENFETILQERSQFSWKGEAHHGRLEHSPDDNVRHSKKESGLVEIIGQHLKQGVHTLKSKVKTIQTGTKNLTSRKKKLDLKAIKNKNFRKNAKSTFKKDYFLFHEKLSQEFFDLRKLNLNMTLPKTFQDLLDTPESQVPTLYFPKEELQEAILDYRDLASHGKFTFSDISDVGPTFKHSGSSKGFETLFFEDAEVQKSKAGKTTSASSGSLSVLYFKDYNRFFLRLNNWLYPLMRRLPVVGMDKNDGSSSRLYCLPGPDGSWYKLRINCYGSAQGLENFESVLQDCSKFSWKGETYRGKAELSPEDRLSGRTARNENINKGELSKDIPKSSQRLSQKLLNSRRSNLNMSLPKSFEELKRMVGSQGLAFYLPKEELEEAIIDYRDTARQGKINLRELTMLRPTIVESAKREVQEIKQTIVGGIERGREILAGGKSLSGNLNEARAPES